MATPIRIWLDDQPHTLPGALSLADFLAQQARAPQSCATALNGQFVPRELRASTELQDGDRVLLFQAIVGG
ncbi:sulfur carrier protein ThiS [Roseateles sp. BYS180W]|uniref:Sulfur carrier protein ThiS n=1 Tax=Roseateles rivi TaxID=3299028 RepID=A0ABW7FWU8_9BURK